MESAVFVSGRVVKTNYILGHLRPRPANAEKLSHIVREITRIWNEAVRNVQDASSSRDGYVRKEGDGRLDDERALHNVFLMEDIVAGSEQGFELPVAGKDGEWARENMAAFEKRATNGDEGMRRLVEEYKARM